LNRTSDITLGSCRHPLFKTGLWLFFIKFDKN